MNLTDRLKQYNAWRRDGGPGQPHPKQIGKDIDEAIARIATLTDQVTSLQNGYDLAMSRLEQPPDGYPSREDWLAKEHRITFDYSYARSAWTFFIDREGSGQFFPDYVSALAAAVKDAGICPKCGNSNEPGQVGVLDPDSSPSDHIGDANEMIEPSGNTGQLPRLVPVETKRPTLDQMPEWERHLCETPEGGKVWMMNIDGDAWYATTDAFARSIHGRMAYTVLDADPIGPKVVGDLQRGDIFHDGDAWCMVRERNGLIHGVHLDTGDETSMHATTPVHGPVYRFEITD